MAIEQELIAALRTLVQGGRSKGRYVRHPGQTTADERLAKTRNEMRREAQLTQALGSPAGLTKIAANMAKLGLVM
jgi:hypothetical protein